MRPSKLIFLTTSWQLFLNSDCESFNGRVISCRRRVIRRSKNSLGNDGGPTYGPGTLIDYDAFPAEPGDDSDQTSFDGEDLDQLWDSVMTVSFLIELNCIWDEKFLDAPTPEAR